MVDTLTPSVLVTVDGTTREATSLRLSRALAWSPDGSDSGITAATGSVRWAASSDTTSRAPHPWSGSGWPPVPSSPITVDVGWDGVLVRQLTGVVDEVTGSFGSPQDAASDVVDLIDRLSVPVDRPALGRIMPTASGVARPGLSTEHLANESMRLAGFHTTPPVQSGSVAAAPLQGSGWPSRGNWGARVSAASSTTAFPSWVVTPWGVGASNLLGNYLPDPPPGFEALSIADGRVLQVVVMVDAAQPGTGFTSVQARWGTSWLGLSVGVSSGNLTMRAVYFNGTSTAVLTSLPVLTATTFSMLVTDAGAVTLYADDARTASGTVTLPSAMTGTAMSEVWVNVPSGAPVVGGAQVAFNSQPVATTWTPTARLAVTAPTALIAYPAVEGTTALSLLRDQAAAQVAAWWLDETGVLQWMDRGVLLGRSPTATITSAADLLDLQWASATSTARSGVQVAWRRGGMRVTTDHTITLWQGRGDSMATDEVSEDFIGPDADGEWFGVREDVLLVGDPGGITALTEGVRTLGGGILVQDGESDQDATSSHVTTTVAPLGRRRWIVQTTAGTIPSGKRLTLRAPDYSTISPSRRGSDLPIVRGRGTASWADEAVTAAQTGPAGMPSLEHDSGLYAQTSAVAQDTADWLAARVTSTSPVVTSLPVVPDLDRRLGDIVAVEDPDRSGMRLIALVTSIDLAVDSGPDRITQTLGVYVITAELAWPTLADVDTAWAGSTLAALETVRTGDTLAEFDTDPLEGA